MAPRNELDKRRMAEQTEALFAHATEGIIITDTGGTITLVNPCALNQFGYSEHELIGASVDILVPFEKRVRHARHRSTFVDQPTNRPMGLDLNLDLFGQRKDGTRFPVEVSLSKYTTDDGTFMVAFVIDITERKKHQDRLEQMNIDLEKKVHERTKSLESALHELEQSREELRRALETERELNEMKSRFVSAASHEFRTPLSTILSSVSLIGKYTTSDQQDKRDRHIYRIKSAINNLTDILNDFLSIGKLEEGAVTPNMVGCDIEDLVSGVVRTIGLIAKPGQDIQFTFHGNRDVVTDGTIVHNILNNLLSNAIKYSPEDSEIELDVNVLDNWLNIRVTDHGIGIPESDHAHMFQRFFRSDNAMNIQGSGLGLHIVSKYVELLHGSITFESIVGTGSTFRVSLPLSNQQRHEETHLID